jgi:hypothetical protein
MSTDSPALDQRLRRFTTTLEALESSAHVPVELQSTEVAEAPGEPPVDRAELNRLRLLGIVGDGRW